MALYVTLGSFQLIPESMYIDFMGPLGQFPPVVAVEPEPEVVAVLTVAGPELELAVE